MRNKTEIGFSLVEVVFSAALLSIAVMGLSLVIPVAIQTNVRNRVDSEAAMVVQRELEQMTAQRLTSTSFTAANGNNISLAAGGSPLANGRIDFAAAPVNGYTGTAVGSSGARYEFRWNVQALADGGKQFIMAARKTGGERFLLPPVQFSVRLGR